MIYCFTINLFFLVQLEKIKAFLSDYFNEYHESFFNGDVLLISIVNKKLLQFNHDGYLIIYDLPIKLIEKGVDKYMKLSSNNR